MYGAALAAEFEVPNERDWAAYRESMWRPQWDFTTRLLDSSAFASALPSLRPPRLGEVGLEPLSPYLLAGDFTRVLHSGGAYLRTESFDEAEELGRQLAREVL